MRTVSRRITTATFDPVGCLRVTGLIIIVCGMRWTNVLDRNHTHEFLRPRPRSVLLVNATALGLAYPAARGTGAIGQLEHVVILQYPICIWASSAKTHQRAYTVLLSSVGISDLKPLTGTSGDQLPHRKRRPLATAVFKAIILIIEPQPAGPTFARHVHDVRPEIYI